MEIDEEKKRIVVIEVEFRWDISKIKENMSIDVQSPSIEFFKEIFIE